MHTYYYEDDNGKWVVAYDDLIDGDDFRVIKAFDTEIQAATYVSFLNGAAHNVAIIDELLQQVSEKGGDKK